MSLAKQRISPHVQEQAEVVMEVNISLLLNMPCAPYDSIKCYHKLRHFIKLLKLRSSSFVNVFQITIL